MTAPLCLLTRPLAQSRAFAVRLPGIAVLIAPILRIEPLPVDAARIAAAPGLVLTSANAVPFAGPARNRPALCVGPQTAECAQQAGFVVEEGPGHALGLLPLLEGRGDWLHLHGLHRARELPVPGIAVYDQLAQPLGPEARAALAGTRPLVLPLFSPRSAALLAEAVAQAVAPITTVAISARADAAYAGPATGRRIAARPAGEAMACAILTLVHGERCRKPWVETQRGGR